MSHILFSKYHKDAIRKTEAFIHSQFGSSKRELYADDKSQSAVESRFVCYFILNRVFRFPSTLIGEVFEKTHSSVLHGVETVYKWGWDEEIERQFLNQFPDTEISPTNYKLSPDSVDNIGDYRGKSD